MSKCKSWFNKGERLVFEEDNREGRLYSTYSLIAKNRFRWNNLPKEIESHKIEEYLYNMGQVAFFKDEIDGVEQFACLPCYMNGRLNIYNEPLEFGVYGIDFNRTYKKEDMVWIKNNDHCLPTRDQVGYYTDWINDIEKTMRRNLKQLRQPDIIASTEKERLSVQNMWKKIEDNDGEPIYYDKEMYRGGEFPIQVLNRNVTNNLESLQKNKNDVMFELLTFLGINNSNTDKKERMLVDEVNVNNIHILMNLDIEYKNRQDACKLINKKFGLNVEVELVIEELQERFMKVDLPNGDFEPNENNQNKE